MILPKKKESYSSIEKSSSGTAEGFPKVSVMLGAAAVQPLGPSSERTEARHSEESCTEAEISRDGSAGNMSDGSF